MRDCVVLRVVQSSLQVRQNCSLQKKKVSSFVSTTRSIANPVDLYELHWGCYFDIYYIHLLTICNSTSLDENAFVHDI